MITLRKLSSLAEGTRRRKEKNLIEYFEQKLLTGESPDETYFRGLLALIGGEESLPEDLKDLALLIREQPPSEERLRALNELKHQFISFLKVPAADWDMPLSGQETAEREIFPIEVYLDDIRSPFNVGSIFRTAESFGVSRIILSKGTADPFHPRARRTAMGCVEKVPWICGSLDEARKPFFGLETGGTRIEQFQFPSEGTVILGSEELGMSAETRKAAGESAGLVTLPTCGSKGSVNVSVAFGILIHQWAQERFF